MPFQSPTPVASLMVLPYILSSELIFFRKKQYFIRLKSYTVSVLVVHEKVDALYIKSLPLTTVQNTRTSAYILTYAEKLARRLGKTRLELSVPKRNAPARCVYRKFSFAREEMVTNLEQKSLGRFV